MLMLTRARADSTEFVVSQRSRFSEQTKTRPLTTRVDERPTPLSRVLSTQCVRLFSSLRLNGGSSGRSGSSSGGSQADVVELIDSNFDELSLNSKDIWLVEFFAPWCGHCKNLAPHWASAASELKGRVRLGALDATVHSIQASKYGVQGYPTIKYFPAGKKDASSAEDYNVGRTSGDIVTGSQLTLKSRRQYYVSVIQSDLGVRLYSFLIKLVRS